MEFLHVVTATIIVFTIALLLGKPKALPDHILATWLFLFLFNTTGFFLLDAKSISFHGWKNGLLQFSDAIVFLHGPMFLLYTMTLTRADFRLRLLYLAHLLPFVIVLSLMINESYYAESPYVPLIETILKIFSLLIYIVTVYVRLLKHRKNIKNIFSNAEQKNLGWLFILSNGFIVLWLVLFITTLFNIVGTMGRISYDGRILKSSTDAFLIFMCYFGVRQPALYRTEDHTISKEDQDITLEVVNETGTGKGEKLVTVKYQRSSLTPGQADEIHKKLLVLMETAKPYLNDDLTLFRLAEMTRISPNHLSQVINLLEGKNFFDFINYYRVKEVKKIIWSTQLNHFTLLGIAFECGFNSKAAFNRAFKKFTGTTPSEFKNNRPS